MIRSDGFGRGVPRSTIARRSTHILIVGDVMRVLILVATTVLAVLALAGCSTPGQTAPDRTAPGQTAPDDDLAG